jgi:succinate dehydrogenase / fumarate reductase flavoprotein subunit
MQGLADGYFVLPYTIGDYLAGVKPGPEGPTDHPEFKAAEDEVTAIARSGCSRSRASARSTFHRELGKIMWDKCGMARTARASEGAREIPRCARSSGAT